MTTKTEDDFNNRPSATVWQKILSKSLTADESSRMASLFSDTDYLETRQFTILHKIVLGLVPRTLESELEYSTQDLDSIEASGRICVSRAAARGNSKALRTLLNYGADVNICDGQGVSPLHHATNIACINLLVNSGAEINARTSFGHTALHTICRGSGSLVLLQHLVGTGLDINAIDRSGETALANAAWNKHAACALYLLEMGANMDVANGPNMSGFGPIHLAVMQNTHEVLQHLLEDGVEYTRANSAGSTILHLAARFADVDTIEIMKCHGLKSINVLHLSSDGGTVKDLLEELEKDANSDKFDTQFRELLQGIGKGQCEDLDTDQSLAIRLSALDTLKSTAIATSILVSSEDEDFEQDFADEDVRHNSPIYFDAMEDLYEMPPTVEVKV